MRARFFSNITQARLAWLLGILLLMPLAQTAAVWHLASHIQSQASERSDDSSKPLADYCDLCQIASATTGGLLPTYQAALFSTALPSEAPRFHFHAAPTKPQWPPYTSRAPPFALN